MIFFSWEIQAILYAFLMGFVYGILFSFKQYIEMYSTHEFAKGIRDLVFHIVFICSCYYGLYRINKGITNIYLILFFLLGIYLFYTIYYQFFEKLYRTILKKLRPLYKKSYLLFSKYYSIINSSKERKKDEKKKKNVTHI